MVQAVCMACDRDTGDHEVIKSGVNMYASTLSIQYCNLACIPCIQYVIA